MERDTISGFSGDVGTMIEENSCNGFQEHLFEQEHNKEIGDESNCNQEHQKTEEFVHVEFLEKKMAIVESDFAIDGIEEGRLPFDQVKIIENHDLTQADILNGNFLEDEDSTHFHQPNAHIRTRSSHPFVEVNSSEPESATISLKSDSLPKDNLILEIDQTDNIHFPTAEPSSSKLLNIELNLDEHAKKLHAQLTSLEKIRNGDLIMLPNKDEADLIDTDVDTSKKSNQDLENGSHVLKKDTGDIILHQIRSATSYSSRTYEYEWPTFKPVYNDTSEKKSKSKSFGGRVANSLRAIFPCVPPKRELLFHQ